MLGYVSVEKSKLTEDEFRIYRGYYCGVCKSIGRRYGHIPRLALSYDSVFLAMLLSSMEAGKEDIRDEHCIIHPIEKNPTVYGEDAVDYAADILIMLAYHNFLDDKMDEHKIRGTIGTSALEKHYKVLSKKYQLIARDIESGLKELSEMERNCESNIDLTSGAFGEILSSALLGYYNDAGRNRVLKELGFYLGKWIYVIDAIDDYDKDIKSGSYNPLMYRERGKEGLDELLYHYLGEVMKAFNLMDIQKNRGIIENIILLGLRGRTDLLLNQEGNNNGRSV